MSFLASHIFILREIFGSTALSTSHLIFAVDSSTQANANAVDNLKAPPIASNALVSSNSTGNEDERTERATSPTTVKERRGSKLDTSSLQLHLQLELSSSTLALCAGA